MYERALDPTALRPINEPTDLGHLERIIESMRASGWVGRKLLVEEVCRLGFSQHFAWTGSHRIVAAIAAGLTAIPCRIIPAAEADASFTRAGYECYGFESWRGAVTSAEGRPGTDARRDGLLRAGLFDAAEMLQEELSATDGLGG